MPVSYENADSELFIGKLIEKVMSEHHPELAKAGVKIGVLMAIAETNEEGEVIDAPVKFGGYPAQAVIQIRNLKDRTLGMRDATITIDANNWKKLTDPQKEALIDHELYHLDLKRDGETDAVVTDDAGRPKFKMRKHDHQFGWFDAVAKRHGDASAEIIQAKEFSDVWGQIYFGFAAPDSARAPESAGESLQKIVDDNDAWRGVLISTLKPGLTKAKLKILDAAGIKTLGDMADHQSRHGEFWVKEIKGLGPEGAKAYEVATDAYFKAHPVKQAESGEKPSATKREYLDKLKIAGETALKRAQMDASDENIKKLLLFVHPGASPKGADIPQIGAWIEKFDGLENTQIVNVIKSSAEFQQVA